MDSALEKPAYAPPADAAAAPSGGAARRVDEPHAGAMLRLMIETRIRANIEAYIAAWNEPDGERRLRLLEQACADDVVLRTPGRRIAGRAELDAMMADFQRRRPGERAVLSSAIDVQGLLFRHAGKVEGASVARGENFDAGECDEDGRIRLLLTFTGSELPSRI